MMTVQCCQCKRIRRDGCWVHSSGEKLFNVSHTYCPACAEASSIEIFAFLASRASHSDSQTLSRLLSAASC